MLLMEMKTLSIIKIWPRNSHGKPLNAMVYKKICFDASVCRAKFHPTLLSYRYKLRSFWMWVLASELYKHSLVPRHFLVKKYSINPVSYYRSVTD